MKRIPIHLEAVAGYNHLASAAARAARGKRTRPEVREFFSDFDGRIRAMGQDIISGSVPYGRFRKFTIRDPKPRKIHAACFPDRVLHHGLMAFVEPVLDRAMVASSFACRKGKGVHRAVGYAQKQMRKYPWFLKVDVRHYFETMDHGNLMAMVGRKFKGQGFLCLMERIMAGYETAPGKGLPIGSLVSQNLANFYLDGLDRYLLEDLKVSAHVRYMDDIMVWCRSREEARDVLGWIRIWMVSRKLRLKEEVTRIGKSHEGVTFCGVRVFPGTLGLTRRKKRRYALLRRQWEARYRNGEIGESGLQAGLQAVGAAVLPARGPGWLTANMKRFPPVE